MREDELERCLHAQKLLLLFHDQVVGPFRIVAVGLIVLGRVCPAAPFIDGKVAVVNRLYVQIHAIKKNPIIRVPGHPPILILKYPGRIRPSQD